jgi:alkanesulfonate monooxygenase SsuD/methylene tetrahydromethanopterin reductase-like flavin-dependent oxidoreductase (luciferase family)
MRFYVVETAPRPDQRSVEVALYQDLLHRSLRAEALGFDAICLMAGSSVAEPAYAFALVLAARLRQIPLLLLPQAAHEVSPEVSAVLKGLLGDQLVILDHNTGLGPYRRVILADSDEAARHILASEPGTTADTGRVTALLRQQLIGGPDTICARLEQLQSEFADDAVLLDFSHRGRSSADAIMMMERFSREIMPRFRPHPFVPPVFA